MRFCLSRKKWESCCAVNSTNCFKQGPTIRFYCFPDYPERQHIAAVRRNHWVPNKYSWLCSGHSVSEKKINDALSPAYLQPISIFSHVSSTAKRKWTEDLRRYERLAAGNGKGKMTVTDRRADGLLASSTAPFEKRPGKYCQHTCGINELFANTY